MTLRDATLIKKATTDGLFEMRDDVPLGRRYVVDMDSRQKHEFFNTVHCVRHYKEMVWEVTGGYLPVELLSIEEGG